ncbi:MAG TPA: gluconate 2-dehydrogenase subunit 3 family protein [Roseiflexaceae bacterium]|nr:gluconate 2-dehydrogenase subunit 3 family protein [Roseiflexaceae bacterium]
MEVDLSALLSERQVLILRVLFDTLIPPDDYAGAWEAGSGNYLARQLQGDLADQLGLYRRGLDALDAEAQFRHGMAFAALDEVARNGLLAQIEQGHTAIDWPIDAAAFFGAACQHAAEGYYSDPGNGGNRDQVAWRMIGFEVKG